MNLRRRQHSRYCSGDINKGDRRNAARPVLTTRPWPNVAAWRHCVCASSGQGSSSREGLVEHRSEPATGRRSEVKAIEAHHAPLDHGNTNAKWADGRRDRDGGDTVDIGRDTSIHIVVRGFCRVLGNQTPARRVCRRRGLTTTRRAATAAAPRRRAEPPAWSGLAPPIGAPPLSARGGLESGSRR